MIFWWNIPQRYSFTVSGKWYKCEWRKYIFGFMLYRRASYFSSIAYNFPIFQGVINNFFEANTGFLFKRNHTFFKVLIFNLFHDLRHNKDNFFLFCLSTGNLLVRELKQFPIVSKVLVNCFINQTLIFNWINIELYHDILSFPHNVLRTWFQIVSSGPFSFFPVVLSVKAILFTYVMWVFCITLLS